MDRCSAAVYGADDKKWEVKSFKRLTFDGNYCDIAQCAETRGGSFCEDGTCSQRKVWERLKEWEDLEEHGRVIVMKNPEQDGMARLRELADADRAGRLVVLPCKVGDTVYFALLGRIIEKQVFSIVSFSNSTRICCGGTSECFRPEDIGKTVFLTHEEAEAALEATEDD